MGKLLLTVLGILIMATGVCQEIKLRKKDRKKDIMMVTDSGTIVLRLSDSTPLHRDNFISLVKLHFYEGISFHRVIPGFVIQAGDPRTKGNGSDTLGIRNPSYTIPAEIRQSFYHKRGVLAAARMGDNVNPQKRSSGTQFYIIHGRVFTPEILDSVETHRMEGKKISADRRQVYQTLGGAPHLDQNYTIFGEVVKGMEVVDKIATTKTTGPLGPNKPLTDIRIKEVKLIRRQKK